MCVCAYMNRASVRDAATLFMQELCTTLLAAKRCAAQATAHTHCLGRRVKEGEREREEATDRRRSGSGCVGTRRERKPKDRRAKEREECSISRRSVNGMRFGTLQSMHSPPRNFSRKFLSSRLPLGHTSKKKKGEQARNSAVCEGR